MQQKEQPQRPNLDGLSKSDRRLESLIYKRLQLKARTKKQKRKKNAPARFNGIMQFIELYNTKEKCFDYLESIRWEHGVYCPFCGCIDDVGELKKYHYHCDPCNKGFTVTTGSILEEGSTGIEHRLTTIYLENSFVGGLTGSEIERQLPVSKKTAANILQQIRRYGYNQNCFDTCVYVEDTPKNIYILDTTLIDGSDKGRHDYKKHSYYGGLDQFTVLTIIQQGGNSRAYIVDGEDRQSVMPFILKHIPKGSIIYTDEHPAFHTLTQMGYEHHAVNHKAKKFGIGSVTTNQVENWNSFFKAGLRKFRNSIPPLYAHLYVDAAVFRYNTRYMNESEKFDLVVRNIFTRFEEQETRVENYHEKLKQHRNAMAEKARESKRRKEFKKRMELERAQKKAKAEKIRLEKAAKKAERKAAAEQLKAARAERKAARLARKEAAEQLKIERAKKKAAAEQLKTERAERKAARLARQAAEQSKPNKKTLKTVKPYTRKAADKHTTRRRKVAERLQ